MNAISSSRQKEDSPDAVRLCRETLLELPGDASKRAAKIDQLTQAFSKKLFENSQSISVVEVFQATLRENCSRNRDAPTIIDELTNIFRQKLLDRESSNKRQNYFGRILYDILKERLFQLGMTNTEAVIPRPLIGQWLETMQKVLGDHFVELHNNKLQTAVISVSQEQNMDWKTICNQTIIKQFASAMMSEIKSLLEGNPWVHDTIVASMNQHLHPDDPRVFGTQHCNWLLLALTSDDDQLTFQ